jgi:ABC-type dipeptide/oligopeptide/nickel transport system permease subunit
MTVSDLNNRSESPPLADGGDIHLTRPGWRIALAAFVENKLAVAGCAIILFFVAFCFIGPMLYHTDQIQTNILQAYQPPGGGHPLGTDRSGFDELGRLMKGGQAALEIGFLSSLIATVIGTIVGTVAGLIGGIVDATLMRLVDLLLSIPLLFVVLIVAARYGATIVRLSVMIGAFSWLASARLVRSEVLSLRARDFVAAAWTMGAGQTRVIRQHLIPNALGVVMVNVTFQVANAIWLLALLGFLGFGLNYPQVDWGDMLSNALPALGNGYWWTVYPVGVCLVLVVMAFNFIGDALRDTVDVRLQQR